MNRAEEKGQIAKTASIVGSATLLSRIAGLARDQVTGYYFGTSIAAAAFVVAFRIPNLFRRLLAEGAFTAAFVPVFTTTLADGGPAAAADLFKKVFTLLALALVLLCFGGVIFAPEVVALMAPGFRDTPEKFTLTVYLARILFPYIFFMGLGALFMGALNSSGYFAAPALGPFVGNLAMIAGTIALSPYMERPVTGLALGALAGGGLQLAIQLPSLRRAGLRLRLDFHFLTPEVKKILLLMGPAALGAAVYQLSIFVNTIMASFLTEGSIPYLYYADRLMQFPLGIFAVALGTAVLPALSRQNALGDHQGFADSAKFALGLSFFITLPAMVGLTVLALPLVTFLFQRGAFTSESSQGTAAALQALALGLPFLSGAGILARIFYSRSNTRTPTLVGMGSLAVGTVLAFILMWPLKFVGLALASSLSSVVNFCWLYGLLTARASVDQPQIKILKEVLVYCFLASLMGLAIWPLGPWALASQGFWFLALKTTISVVAGVLVYFGLAVAAKCSHAVYMVNLVKRRFCRRPV